MSARKYEITKTKRYGNIKVVVDGAITSVFLHNNPIAHVDYSAMHIEISSCGWRTVTTKTALNTLFTLLNVHYRVRQANNTWYVNGECFRDNMLLPLNDNPYRK